MIEFNSNVPTGFETYNYMVGNNTSLGTGISDTFYWSVLSALDKHSTYLRMSNYAGWYVDDNNQPVHSLHGHHGMGEAVLWHVAHARSSAPSAWVAMRDYLFPICYYNNTYDCENSTAWPDLGNFEYWLYQYDTISGFQGGQTKPETHQEFVNSAVYGMQSPQMGLCPAGSEGPAGYPCFTNVYNSQLPKVREAQFIRRTDQATNNPYMWFDIDDEYAYNSQGLSTDITVTYWDHGTDKFRLQYNSFSGPKYATPQGGSNPWVQKTNSSQFRQVVFRLNDARFTNSLAEGIDFKIELRATKTASMTATNGSIWLTYACSTPPRRHPSTRRHARHRRPLRRRPPTRQR